MPSARRDFESSSLQLLSEVQFELQKALTEAKESRRENLPIENYPIFAASHANRAIEGYIYLRGSERFDASKHLIRNVIEVVLKALAAYKRPELLFRLLFTEHEEDTKWLRATAGKKFDSLKKPREAQWNAFKLMYQSKFPSHAAEEKMLSIFEIAKEAGAEGYYGSHYRLYCRFTHGAIRATTGRLDGYDSEDNRTMALCGITLLDILGEMGVSVQNVESLRTRRVQIGRG